jgi:hypothetical protein
MWLIAATVLLALGVGALVALPPVVRLLAERRAEALLGREVTIGDVDLNLFTQHLVAGDVRVHGHPGEPPPLILRRLDARFDLLPLLQGRAHLDRLALDGLDVHVQRTAPDRFSISDVVEHVAARPDGEPVRAVIDALVVTDARARLDDEVVDPGRTWVLGDLALEARDVVTVSEAAQGRATATFVLAGAPGLLEIQGLGLSPPQARMTLMLDGLDIGRLGAYFPADAALRLAGGSVTTRFTMEYDAAGAVHGGGEITLRELSFAARGQEPPLLTAPNVTVTGRDLAYRDGDVTAGRLELAADRLAVLDASAPRARPLDVTALRASWQARGTRPGDLRLDANLPGGARLDVGGTADLSPLTADLRVEVAALDVALARIWIPDGAPLEPVSGQLAAGLDVAYGGAAGLVVGGTIQAHEVAVARAGQDAPFLRDERIVAHVRQLTRRDGTLGLQRLEVAGSPTLVDARATPPRTLHLPRLALVAEEAAVPGDQPARVRLQATLPQGGRLEAEGTAAPAPVRLSLDVRAHDVNLMVAAPWIPEEAPITLGRGRLDGRLSVAWDGALRGHGSLVAQDLALLRRDQPEPFIHHPSLSVTLTGLLVDDGQLSLERLALAGAPTIVDATASPPQRVDVQSLTLAVADFTWPGRRPARVEGSADVAEGGRARLQGTIHPGTQATEVRARFDNVDLTRANGYRPAAVPLDIAQGRGEATVSMRYRRTEGVRLDAEGVLHELGLDLAAGPGLHVRDERVAFGVTNLVVGDGAVSVEAATVDGAPAFARPGETAPALSRLHAELRGLHWPQGADARWQLVAEPPDGGRVVAQGTLAAGVPVVRGTVVADDASLAVAGALIPLSAPVRGRLDARLTLEAGADRPPALEGEATLREVTIGPADTPPVRIARVSVSGLEVVGRELAAAQVALEQPTVVVEREADGAFPLRTMLTPPSPAAPAEDGGRKPPDPAAGREVEPADALSVRVGEIVIREGDVRFIDRATTPFYSEELSRLAVTIQGLDSENDRPPRLQIQGIVGVDAALDLQGVVAPFATPFVLDVSGELRDFAISRTNPYLQRLLDWIARAGELTTRVHYRIEGGRLTATNEVVVERLAVERARDDDRSERLVGIPLGLAVALLKNARGEIHVTVPISGELSSPRFSFGDAIRTALKNVVGRLLTAPFRAIGSVLRRDGTVEAVAIEPVTFPAGSAVLTPEAAAHLQRVADFLRSRPYVRLTLEPVVGEDDLEALRVQEVTARIQQRQRADGLDFTAAARQAWAESGQAPPVPEDPQDVVRALATREPTPTEAARRLAERRLSVTRTHLVDAAGIQRERLLGAPGAASLEAADRGRVEFELRPGS